MKAALYHQSPTTEQKLNTNYKTWQNQTFLTFKKGKTGLIRAYKAGYILFTFFRIRKNVRNKIIMVCQFQCNVADRKLVTIKWQMHTLHVSFMTRTKRSYLFHAKVAHLREPKTVLDSVSHAVIQVLNTGFFVGSNRKWGFGFLKLYPGFQSLGFLILRIPDSTSNHFPDSGIRIFLYER